MQIITYICSEVYTNATKRNFSPLESGLSGSYHNVSKQYRPFYINKFDFRYNFRKVDDNERAIDAIKGFELIKLTLRVRKSRNGKQHTQQDEFLKQPRGLDIIGVNSIMEGEKNEHKTEL